jgi:hypothetical protein
MSTIYSIGYSSLNFSKLFTIQGGKVKLFEGVPPYLFIYSVVQNDPELMDFGLINSLPFSKYLPSTYKNVSCLRKGV